MTEQDLDRPSLRVDARPSETERQYRERVRPELENCQQCEQASEEMMREALKQIK